MKAYRIVFVLIVIALIAGIAAAQNAAPAKAKNAVFEKMKTLSGEWEGKGIEGEKKFPTRTTFRVVSDGSAILNELDPDSPQGMITMFHLDGPDVIATHYCSAHNQPRMKASAGADPNNILFEFKDATNVGPGEGRMDHVRFIFVDADHHIQEWSYMEKGKIETGRFEFHRKGKS